MVNERGKFSNKEQAKQKCKKWDELNRKINEEERGNGLDNERLQGNYRLKA